MPIIVTLVRRNVIPGSAKSIFQGQTMIRTPPVFTSFEASRVSDVSMRVLRRAQGANHGNASSSFQDADRSVQTSIIWIKSTS
jgi:hypothetical protein